MKQEDDKPVDQFVTRLKQKAQKYDSVDPNCEREGQIVFNCH